MVMSSRKHFCCQTSLKSIILLVGDLVVNARKWLPSFAFLACAVSPCPGMLPFSIFYHCTRVQMLIHRLFRITLNITNISVGALADIARNSLLHCLHNSTNLIANDCPHLILRGVRINASSVRPRTPLVFPLVAHDHGASIKTVVPYI